ncbi:related to S.pombe rad8 protein and Rdh54p [Phialocephala subalpina]|uniref:Related to S.pombe rad8 protein and Rdh54p n=1 Tax=Phialocephala subalpina TaxID=576137 RepID=A0A1L7WYQ7_9HELO|nr:related to S.pombe rad8 protein and Rdh54p [Phialocephala subalpina]
MGRKVIARGVGRGGRIGGRSTTSSNLSTPSSGTSRDLSDDLLDYARETHVPLEPPKKRQKTSAVSRGEEAELEHIVVKKSHWDIPLVGSRLAELQTPIARTNIPLYVHWNRYGPPEYVGVMDDAKNIIFYALLPPEEELEDVHVALLVDRDSKKWAKAQGRLWTTFDLSLDRRDGGDDLRLTFTVKWSFTINLYHLPQASARTAGLCRVLEKYFPDSTVTKGENWSPQDFYQSVHAPDKNDDLAATMLVESLETNLYPFQKRAVQWLLRREGVEWSRDGRVRDVASSGQIQLPISFIQAEDTLGHPCYVSHLFGIVTSDLQPFTDFEQQLRGGLLAEEMGLGKTVEMISLITLHKRPLNQPDQVYDLFTAQNVRPTKGTLIVAPPSLLQQWISEIHRHAPELKTFHYEGIRRHSSLKLEELLRELVTADIVISTYSVLAAEIHFTQLNPEKSLRRESRYPRPKSPLMMLSWWRVCIDEAQMLETGVSNAAIVARMIPRINAWCVTGTPVRKDVNDLLGLLVFLRYEPFASIKHVWSSLIREHKQNFRKLFGTLALRHSKQQVRDELKLPAQRRYVITMPFTPIEEQHYQELFNQMCAESGLNSQGAPLTDNWDPENVSDVMRQWLVRLRQTALHPEVGGRNRRALGHRDGPLRTVDQVLNVMMDQTDLAIRTDHRTLLLSKLKRGQLFENSPRVQEALGIWEEVVKEAAEVVDDCREQLRQELVSVAAEGKSAEKESNDASDTDAESSDESARLGVFRNRLRGALEILHVAVFFRSNALFQIKSYEDMTKPDSDEFKELEKLETQGYEEAKKLRREILQEIYQKANRLMSKVAKSANSQSFAQIPEFSSSQPGGLESRRIVEQLEDLAIALDAQANTLDEWREQTIQFLLRPLVDEDEGLEITGDEYEDSTKLQDEVEIFLQALRAAIADRHDALTGQQNALVEYDVKTALDLALGKKDTLGEGIRGPAPEKMIEMLGIRREIKPARTLGSVRGFVAELRTLATSLRPNAENGNARAQNELTIVEKQLKDTQKQLSEQMKVTAALEKEVEMLTDLMNYRLSYYRQLQEISDMIIPYEGPNDESILAKMLKDEEAIIRKIAVAKSKRRYLEHLRLEATNPQEQKICVICRESFEVGALTVCGHQYCKECIRLWWNAHRNCPVCKKKLTLNDLHEITYKNQGLTVETEDVHDASHERSSPSKNRKSAIYSEFSKAKLAEIKQIELDGPCFTTKVDTLARHLIWLRESDPGAKSIIYSQFKDFLDVLSRAFSRYRIGFSSIDKANGIERFKNDPGVECFLLHARAHSSGLNLVNASHVFLTEPLLNVGLELQAIARVDRIGQHQETNVWLYLVDGTVEESIHQLSVKRRLEHIGKRLSGGKGKSKELSPDELLDSNLEEANSLELQEASLANLLEKGGKGKGGEFIAQEDLWDCLFGGVAQRTANRALDNSSLRLDEEVGRHLRAEAAEERIVIRGVEV